MDVPGYGQVDSVLVQQSLYLVGVVHIVPLALNTQAIVESMVGPENSRLTGAVAGKVVFQPLHILGLEKDKLVTDVEISIRDDDVVGRTLHLNIYDFTKDQFQEMEEISSIGDLMDLLAYLNRSFLPHTYNHPFWFEPGEKPNLAAVLGIMALFPVIEYNRRRAQRKKKIAVELAQKFENGLTATTDTHSGRVGDIYTLSKGEDFGEYFRRIREGNSYIAVTALTNEDVVREVNAWIDLLSCPDLIQSDEIVYRYTPDICAEGCLALGFLSRCNSDRRAP